MVTKDDLLIPPGWVKAFGDDLVKELNKADPGIEILESKEKYGELRLTVMPWSEAVSDIEYKYAEISRHTCINCGKPDVQMTNFGWISPVCKDCWSKFSRKPYEECASGEAMCPPYITIRRYNPKWRDDEERHIDLSEEMRRIRKRFRDENENIAVSSGSDADAFPDEDIGAATGTDKE